MDNSTSIQINIPLQNLRFGFQIIDQGIPPDKKIRPRRALSLLLASVIGLLIGVFLAFFMESITPAKESP